MINIAFSALAVLHLTYLGSVFNSSVDYMEEDEVRSTCPRKKTIYTSVVNFIKSSHTNLHFRVYMMFRESSRGGEG